MSNRLYFLLGLLGFALVSFLVLTTSLSGRAVGNASLDELMRQNRDLQSTLDAVRRTLETQTSQLREIARNGGGDDEHHGGGEGNGGGDGNVGNDRDHLDSHESMQQILKRRNESSPGMRAIRFNHQPYPITPWWHTKDHHLSLDSGDILDATRAPGKEKYLLFETWKGGFNNDRMSMETIFVMAFLTGRTLVLPPRYYLYRLGVSNIDEYFEKEDMRFGVRIMQWEAFAKLHPGLLKVDSMENVHQLPDLFEEKKESQIIFHSVWCYPRVPNKDTEPEEHERAMKFGHGRSRLLDASYFQDKTHVFFGERILLSHFYTWFWFSRSAREIERHVKDLVRDHVHYPQPFLDLANRIIARLPTTYVSYHIRRGDFQYQEQRYLDWQKIWDNTRNLLLPDEAVYISTDEENVTTIQPLFDLFERNGHRVYSLYSLGADTIFNRTNPFYYGMIEQMVCSRGRTFVQTRLSTFSGYIQRLRMYMDDTRDDYRILYTDSHYPTHYQWVVDEVPEFGRYPLWAREFFAAIEDWDHVRPTFTAFQH